MTLPDRDGQWKSKTFKSVRCRGALPHRNCEGLVATSRFDEWQISQKKKGVKSCLLSSKAVSQIGHFHSLKGQIPNFWRGARIGHNQLRTSSDEWNPKSLKKYLPPQKKTEVSTIQRGKNWSIKTRSSLGNPHHADRGFEIFQPSPYTLLTKSKSQPENLII